MLAIQVDAKNFNTTDYWAYWDESDRYQAELAGSSYLMQIIDDEAFGTKFPNYLDNFYTVIRRCPEAEYNYEWLFDTCVDTCPSDTTKLDENANRCNYICNLALCEACVDTDDAIIYPYSFDCLTAIYDDCCDDDPATEC